MVYLSEISESLFIISSSGVLFYLTMGMAQSNGIVYSELLDHFQSGYAETSWISSLSTGIMLSIGPIACIIEKRFGCRIVAGIGSITITIGMFGCGFVNSLHMLYLTYGITCGIGFGLSLFAANVIMPFHFNKRLSLATALASAGGGIGTITMPLLTRMWLQEYSWRGTFIIMSGVCMQGMIFVRFFKTSKGIKADSKHDKLPFREMAKSLTMNKKFCIYLLSSFLIVLVYFTIYLVLPDVAKQRGLSEDEAAILITTAGVSSIVGKVLIGLVADIPTINRYVLNGIVVFFGGLTTIGCSFVNNYSLFLAYSIFLGVFTGTFSFLQGPILVDAVGKDLLSIAFGMFSLCTGISTTIGSPLAGWIVDSRDRYDEALCYIGGVFIFGGLLSIVIPFCERWHKLDLPNKLSGPHMKNEEKNGLHLKSYINTLC